MNRERLSEICVLVWALTFAHTAKAVTMLEFMGNYDEQLLFHAAKISLLGGVIRTIFSLQTDTSPVKKLLSTAAWDALKALGAGMLVFITIQAMRSEGYPVSTELRFLAIFTAGLVRFAMLGWLKDAALKIANARTDQIAGEPIERKKDTL